MPRGDGGAELILVLWDKIIISSPKTRCKIDKNVADREKISYSKTYTGTALRMAFGRFGTPVRISVVIVLKMFPNENNLLFHKCNRQCRPEGRENGALAPPRASCINNNNIFIYIYCVNKNISKHFSNDFEFKCVSDSINVYKVK